MKGNDDRRRRSRPREPERRSQHSPTRRERCTRETLNLARVANRHRSSGSRAAGGVDRPKPKTRPSMGTRPSSTTTRPEPSGAGSSGDDPMPMTMSMAVDTWMLVLGLRGINDTACDAFLPRWSMDSIGDTFLDHSPSDRLMLMLVQKLAWGLISAMGEAIQQATQSEASEEVDVALEDDGAAYLQTSVTSGRGEVPDETSYMQATSSEGDPWQQLLQELLAQLEARGKDYSRQVAEWMVGQSSVYERC